MFFFWFLLGKFFSGLFEFRNRYPIYREDAERDYAVLAFDGFPQFLENLEIQSNEEKEKGKQLLNILMDWVCRNSKVAHVVFIGENVYGEDTLRQSNHSSLISDTFKIPL